MESRKRQSFTLAEKVSLIRKVESHPEKSKAEIAASSGVRYSTLCSIVSKKEAILEEYSRLGNTSAKRTRQQEGRFTDLEKALNDWFKQQQADDEPVSSDMLKEKAKELAKLLNVSEEFKASSGWLQGFKTRHGISAKLLTGGESKAVDEYWLQDTIPGVVKQYQPKNIYSCDELGLYYNLLPNERLAGDTKSRRRVTILLATNADGSDKLTPLVIGEHPNPKSLKGVKVKPTDYESNPNCWMSTEIMQKWLKKIDAELKSRKKKIVLFMNCSAAHPKNTTLDNVCIKFFPSKCKNKLQPFHLGIITNFKVHYRNMIVRHLLAQTDVGDDKVEINMLQAMEFIVTAWKDVSSAMIKSCFRKAGMLAEDSSSGSEPSSEYLPEDVNFDLYVHCDDNLSVCGDEDIDEDLYSEQNDLVLSENNVKRSKVDVDDDSPNFNEVLSALEICKQYILSKDDSEKAMDLLTNLRNELFALNVREAQQRKISDFLLHSIF